MSKNSERSWCRHTAGIFLRPGWTDWFLIHGIHVGKKEVEMEEVNTFANTTDHTPTNQYILHTGQRDLVQRALLPRKEEENAVV